jgi:thiamine-phosphate pyrophosphorylase
MKKKLPNLFIFVDKYDEKLFKNTKLDIGIIYRNYNVHNRGEELLKIAKECKKRRYSLFVSNNFKLAIKSKADGIYIPAFNRKEKFLNLEKKNLKIIGSAHNQKEIKEKIIQKCEVIFLSPVFYVEKSKKYLGIHKFNYLSRSNKIDFMALGGINKDNIYKLRLLNAKGLGGIRLFKKKPAYKRPVFLKNKFF